MAAPQGIPNEALAERVRSSRFSAKDIATAARVHPNTVTNLVSEKRLSRVSIARIEAALDSLEAAASASPVAPDLSVWNRPMSAAQLKELASRLAQGLSQMSFTKKSNPKAISDEDLIDISNDLVLASGALENMRKMKYR